MLEHALSHFPELTGKNITVGYTRAHLGSAVIAYRAGVVLGLTIRLKVRKLSYQTIGHELTHLIQGLARSERSKSGRRSHPIPSGEKQCDIWTLARDRLFCDDPPTYLRLPRIVRDRWIEYAEPVRALCIASIEKRKTHRLYIQWLESELRKLGKVKPPPPDPQQLSLPFK